MQFATIAPMEMAYGTWAFVITLVAVINGLGIVRLLSAMSDYLRMRRKLNVRHYWVFSLLLFFQLLVHVLLWWSLLGVREAGNINFLSYLYLLAGPTLLFLGSGFLVPDVDSEAIDMRQEYAAIRKPYYSLATAFFLWAIFLWPVFVGRFAPTATLLGVFFTVSAVLRITDNARVHSAGVAALFITYCLFVTVYAMQLGEVGRAMIQG